MSLDYYFGKIKIGGKMSKTNGFIIDVLDLFLSVPESVIKGFDRKEFGHILSGLDSEQIISCKNIAQVIAKLKRSNYIEVEKNADKESIRFTNKARLAIVDKVAKKSITDKKHRFVSFDIPERLRFNRDKFRRTIKRLGFVQIQKSLWVCGKEVGDYVELAASEYKVSDYIVYIVSENTNIDGFITKLLK